MEPNKELEKAIANKFVTPQKFAMDIEKIVVDEDLNYIDAIIHYCEINNIEAVSYTHLRAHETFHGSRMPSSA